MPQTGVRPQQAAKLLGISLERVIEKLYSGELVNEAPVTEPITISVKSLQAFIVAAGK